jgi:CHAD domain-containing protein
MQYEKTSKKWLKDEKKEAKILFLGDIDCIEALSLILYKYAIFILYYKSQYLQKNDPETLHNLRVNLRRSRAFIKSFKRCFLPKHYKQIYKNFTKIADKTNSARDLDVLIEKLRKNGDDNALILIEKKRILQTKKMIKLLSSDDFNNFFKKYIDDLHNLKLFNLKTSPRPIKKEALATLATLHKKIIKKIKKSHKKLDAKKIHKIRISFKKIRYILEEFKDLLKNKRVKRYNNDLKKLQTLLGKYNDTLKQIKLLKDYRKHNKNTKQKIPKSLIKDLKKDANRLSIKIQKRLHKFSRKDLF